jgi:secreted trypsin-like serine protease
MTFRDFGVTVYPICINQTRGDEVELKSFNYDDKTLEFVSIETEKCTGKVSESKSMTSSEICVERSRNESSTTCSSSSDSILQTNCDHPAGHFTLLGIFSHGNFCDSSSPRVIYTRVASYLDWIEETVWPEEFVTKPICGLACYVSRFFTFTTIIVIAISLLAVIFILLISLLCKWICRCC